MNVKAIVTGASGFVGKHLVAALTRRGLEVLGIDRVHSAIQEHCEFILSDLRDTSSYDHIFEPGDIVFHLAAAKGDWGLSQAEYYEHNVNATKALLSVCSHRGVMRHIFFSTVAVYGPADSQKNEGAPFAPTTAYGRSKAEAEQLYMDWVREHARVSIAILRPSAIFGVDEPSSSNIYRLIEAIRKKRFLMVGDGSALKSTSYIENTIAAAEFLLENPMDGLSSFIYVDEPVLTNQQLVDIISETLGMLRKTLHVPLALAWPIALIADSLGAITRIDFPITAARIKKFCTSTNFSSRKLRDLGFTPPVCVENAIQRTVQWHSEHI